MFSKAIIYAGGNGSRMSPLTDYVPKALVRVNGKPLIKHVISFLKDNEIDEIYCTYGHLGNKLVNELYNEVSGFINTTSRDNSYFLSNSFVKKEDQPIVVCPCDLILELDLKRVYEEYIDLNSPACCIVPIKRPIGENPIADFIHIDEENFVLEINRTKESKICASGVQIVNPKKISNVLGGRIKESFYELWKDLISIDSLCCVNTAPKSWKSYDDIKSLE